MFKNVQHPQNPWILTYPQPGCPVSWDDPWKRSIIKEGNRVISVGFPKFFNLGEADNVGVAAKNLDKVLFAEKLDGSLIIVSPMHKIIRTRGSFDIGLPPACQEEVRALMPELPNDDRSYLFEYVSPRNQIVIKYDTPRLVYLGAVDHLTLRYMTPHQSGIHIRDSVIYAHRFFASLDDMCAWVEASGGEGVVGNFGGTLIKIKTKKYLELHRIATIGSRLREFIFENKIDSAEKLAALLDWEISQQAEGYIQEYKEAQALHQKRVAQAKEWLNHPRKYITRDAPQELHRVIFSLMDGKDDNRIQSQFRQTSLFH